MQHDFPVITIGITCFNAADTIGRAVESALAQDWPNTEIVIVDDCSNDGSVSVVEGFAGVRLICHDVNQGPGGARQSLLDAAKGEFLVFFDDDDESLPGRLRAQYERILEVEREMGGDFVACYASGTRVYPNGYDVEIEAIGRGEIVPYGRAMADRILYFGNVQEGWCYGASPSCALMARVETFRQCGGFDVDFRRVEDLDFAVRLALKGGVFAGCTEKLFIQHATQASDKSYEKNLEAELQLVEKHKAYLREQGRYFYAKTWPKLRYAHFKRNYAQFLMVLLSLLLRHPVQVLRHILRTGPQRLVHESKMRKKRAVL